MRCNRSGKRGHIIGAKPYDISRSEGVKRKFSVNIKAKISAIRIPILRVWPSNVFCMKYYCLQFI